MPDRPLPTPSSGPTDDDLFPRPVRPAVFALLWALLLLLISALTVVVVLYLGASGR